ncbi:hypothetical protein [Mesotoga sp.]|uniref:hypothetical protein n=1 Tax=Mesotoga sp. TaxID=2053577 RepID=UPI00345E170D
MRHVRRSAILLVILAIILGGEALLAGLTYGYVTPGPDTWYRKDVEGFEYAASLVGAQVVVLNSDYDTEKEITNINTLVNMGVDGMCVFSFNPNGAFIAARKPRKQEYSSC